MKLRLLHVFTLRVVKKGFLGHLKVRVFSLLTFLASDLTSRLCSVIHSFCTVIFTTPT